MLSFGTLGITTDMLLDAAPVGIFVVDRGGLCRYVNPYVSHLLGLAPEDLQGEAYLDVFAVQDRPRVQELLSAMDPGVKLVARLGRAVASPRHVLLHVLRLTDDLLALTCQDFTEEMRAQRNALAQSQIAAYLTYGESLQVTMDVLAENVCQATGCSACAVTLVHENPVRQQVIGAWATAEMEGRRLRDLCGRDGFMPIEAWQTGLPVVRTHALSGEGAAPVAGDGVAPPRGEGDDSPSGTVVTLPLRYQGLGLGALSCLYASDYLPDDLEMRFLQTIADQAAVAVENARLFAEVQGKAALEERQRLARDLHDSVSQALYGIGLGAHTALKRLKEDPQKAVAAMEYVLSLAGTGLAEMRALIFDLRPDALENEGLVPMLRHQLHALNARLGVEVVDGIEEEPPLAPTAREALYRVSREATANVVKHASAHRLEVALRVEGGMAILTVTDDGVGFDPRQKFPGHLGLTSMRERVTGLGGDFSVESASGRGTTIRARVPLGA